MCRTCPLSGCHVDAAQDPSKALFTIVGASKAHLAVQVAFCKRNAYCRTDVNIVRCAHVIRLPSALQQTAYPRASTANWTQRPRDGSRSAGTVHRLDDACPRWRQRSRPSSATRRVRECRPADGRDRTHRVDAVNTASAAFDRPALPRRAPLRRGSARRARRARMATRPGNPAVLRAAR